MKALLLLIVLVAAYFVVAPALRLSSAMGRGGCDISGAEFSRRDLSDAIVIDARTPGEYRSGHVKGAVLLNVRSSDFGARILKLDKDARYYVYCKTGIRSARAVEYMRNQGFEHVCNVEGGLLDLKKHGMSFVP